MCTSTCELAAAEPDAPDTAIGLDTVLLSLIVKLFVFSKVRLGGGWVPPPRVAAAAAMADANVLTCVYTPGFCGRAQPMPQLTMPTWIHALLLSRRNIGPPESPWHVSTPPLVQLPAQISSLGTRS